MRCPQCDIDDNRTIDSRSTHQGHGTRRRLQCVCGVRFTTYEHIEDEEGLEARLSNNLRVLEAGVKQVLDYVVELRAQVSALRKQREQDAFDHHPQTKMTMEDRVELREAFAKGMPRGTLAKKYGISVPLVNQILKEENADSATNDT